MFDDRIFKIIFRYGNNQVTIDTSDDPANPIYIAISGVKYADATQNECTLQIGNLSKSLRDALATNLTPLDYNVARKSMEIWAGRVSTGLTLKYIGDIISGVPSQPPDVTMTFRSKTCYFYKQDILAQSFAITTPLSQIASGVANSLGLNLQFEASERMIANYSYNGSKSGQVAKVGAIGGVDAYVDDDRFVCKNKGVPLANVSHVLSAETGMIGQPEVTEWGVRVKCLMSPNVIIGGTLTLSSNQNPSLNGDYTIYRVGFELASRDAPFYDVIEATRYPQMFFTASLPT